MSIDYQTQRNQLLPHNRTALMEALKAHQIEHVTITYSGGGDSGDCESVTTQPELTKDVLESIRVAMHSPHLVKQENDYQSLTVAVHERLETALREFTLDVVSHFQSGWENNDGGSGELVFDVATDTCRLQHTTYFTESADYEYAL